MSVQADILMNIMNSVKSFHIICADVRILLLITKVRRGEEARQRRNKLLVKGQLNVRTNHSEVFENRVQYSWVERGL